jgi:hypothetical protein
MLSIEIPNYVLQQTNGLEKLNLERLYRLKYDKKPDDNDTCNS